MTPSNIRQTSTQLFKRVGATEPAKPAEGSGAGQCWRVRGGRERSADRSVARWARSDRRPQRSASTAQRSDRRGSGVGVAVAVPTNLVRPGLMLTGCVTMVYG